jgi:hypothetical protein
MVAQGWGLVGSVAGVLGLACGGRDPPHSRRDGGATVAAQKIRTLAAIARCGSRIRGG